MNLGINIPKEWFWDVRKPLSYNCTFNLIMGMRSGGKTYGSLRRCIGNFIKSNGEQQFVYLRRYKTELEKITQCRNGHLFNSVRAEFPGRELKAESNVLTCDGEQCGYAIALSTSRQLKSDDYSNVTDIIFDEFLIPPRNANVRYLPGEIELFNDLYVTIARLRKNVKVWFLGNALSVVNPYFEAWNLSLPRPGEIRRFGEKKDVLVQNFVSPELSLYLKNSPFGRLIADTEYADYAFDNALLYDNADFIEKKTRASFYHMTLIFKGRKIGIWLDERQGLYYVSNDVLNDWERVYSVTTDDHRPNVMLMRYDRSSRPLKLLIRAYESGCIRYESQGLKHDFREIMRLRNV